MARKLGTNDKDYPGLMERQYAADFIGIGKDNFDLMFSEANFPDFPRVYVKSDLRFPRDAVAEWLAVNWERLPREKWKVKNE
ncbi:MAG: hypothetical protein LBV19_06215 [Streptococcaceae bacterium]|jgi:hypothetical protein|nr:hypothetical protein [Streptococcaceae bacterium]